MFNLEERLGMFGIEVATGGALVDFRSRLLNRLSHLPRRKLCI